MRSISFFNLFLLGLFLYGCSQKKSVHEYYLEKSYSKDILQQYEKLIKIGAIDSSKHDIDIRFWLPFRKDSFPVELNHIYADGNSLTMNKYMFFYSDTLMVESAAALLPDRMFNYIKIAIQPKKQGIIDSIRNKYNLKAINTLDLTLLKSTYNRMLADGNFGYCLIENKIDNEIKTFFMESPVAFGNINQQYANISDYYLFFSMQCFNLNDTERSLFRQLSYKLLQVKQ